MKPSQWFIRLENCDLKLFPQDHLGYFPTCSGQFPGESFLSAALCLSLEYVAVEVVEDEGEEQVEDHKVANDESWYEDQHAGWRISLLLQQHSG